MPLENLHPLAFKAAQAASCAGEQGKYWEMHDRLFANQQALEPWTAHAEAVGLELPRFEECLTSGRLGPEIRRRMGEGRKARVSSTPSFVIGRTEAEGATLKVLAVVRGAKPFAELKAELDKLLAEAEKPAAAAEAAKQ